MLTRLPAAFVTAVLVTGTVASGATSAHAADEADCVTLPDDAPPATTEIASRPLQYLNVAEAHALFDSDTEPGAGVKVAVVDSGVADTDYLDDVERLESDIPDDAPLDFHGTAVAGLIAGNEGPAGLTGVAPGATIVDVRVYDTEDPTSSTTGAVGLDPDEVVAGLERVLDAVRTDPDIKVVNVSLAMGDSPRLRRVIRQLVKEDVVVVTASGNRPTEDGQFGYGDFVPQAPSPQEAGEDAATYFFPAGYEPVLTVNASGVGWSTADVRDFVLQNSMTDVAVPTYNAVTLDRQGGTCRLLEPLATSWAAAEVSGVVAMLRSWYPQESARQIIARLKTTANGMVTESQPSSRLVGAGMVQPVEAMTRPLTIARNGRVVAVAEEPHEDQQAQAPAPELDPLGSMRDDAVWWGLLSGGVIVLALLVRPIIGRLRRP